MKKENCTESCKGIIIENKVRSRTNSNLLTVEYEVSGKKHQLKEQQIMKPYKKIKLGFIPIGYKARSLIEINTGISTTPGNKVTVKYNKEKPQEAYLKDNNSKITWY